MIQKLEPISKFLDKKYFISWIEKVKELLLNNCYASPKSTEYITIFNYDSIIEAERKIKEIEKYHDYLINLGKDYDVLLDFYKINKEESFQKLAKEKIIEYANYFNDFFGKNILTKDGYFHFGEVSYCYYNIYRKEFEKLRNIKKNLNTKTLKKSEGFKK